MNSSANDRLLKFSVRHKIIEHSRYLHAMQKIEELHQRSTLAGVAGGLLITGHTGSGKSTVKTQYAERFPRIVEEERTFIKVLVVDTPSSPTVRSLVTTMLVALEDPKSHKGTAEEKTERLYKLILGCGVELLIIDEFQHFLDRGRFSEACTVTDWLKNLINYTNIPVVVIGLPRSAFVLEINEQLRRRFSSRNLLEPFTFEHIDAVQEFRALMQAIQQQLPIPCIAMSDYETAKRFYIATHGLMDYLAKIVDGAIQIAFTRRLEEVDLRTFAESFKETVWSECPTELNPFSENSRLKRLIDAGEPFSFVAKEFDTAQFRHMQKTGRRNRKF
jgi:Cdc6-like AAA superfamily ATPase